VEPGTNTTVSLDYIRLPLLVSEGLSTGWAAFSLGILVSVSTYRTPPIQWILGAFEGIVPDAKS
jgi:hypothetical protein